RTDYRVLDPVVRVPLHRLLSAVGKLRADPAPITPAHPDPARARRGAHRDVVWDSTADGWRPPPRADLEAHRRRRLHRAPGHGRARSRRLPQLAGLFHPHRARHRGRGPAERGTTRPLGGGVLQRHRAWTALADPAPGNLGSTRRLARALGLLSHELGGPGLLLAPGAELLPAPGHSRGRVALVPSAGGDAGEPDRPRQAASRARAH